MSCYSNVLSVLAVIIAIQWFYPLMISELSSLSTGQSVMRCCSIILSVLAGIITIQWFNLLMIRWLDSHVNLTVCYELLIGHIVGSSGYYCNLAVLSSDDLWDSKSVNITACH